MFRHQGNYNNNGLLASSLLLVTLIAGWGSGGKAMAALAAGCVAGGGYSSSTSGFTATDFDFSGGAVTTGGTVSLSFSTPLTMEQFSPAFDGDVYMAFIHEDPADNVIYNKATLTLTKYNSSNALGWYIRPLVEKQMASMPYKTINYATDASGYTYPVGISFDELYLAHQDYMTKNNNDRLLTYLFPYMYDPNSDGVFDVMADPATDNYDPKAPGVQIGFTSTGAPAADEGEYAAYGYLANFDGLLDVRDSRVKIGRFKAGTDISFFMNLDRWDARTTHVPVDAATGVNWSNTSVGFFYPQINRNGKNPACTNTGKAKIMGKYDLFIDAFETELPEFEFTRTLYLEFDLDWPPPESVSDVDVSGKTIYEDGPDCDYVKMDYKGGGGTQYPYTWRQGLIPTVADIRLTDVFGLSFTGLIDAGTTTFKANKTTLKLKFGLKNPFFFIAPEKDPFATLMTTEAPYNDMLSGPNFNLSPDFDFNDNMFLIEGKAGGVVAMKATSSPSVALTASEFITSATIKVTDTMPSASCGLDNGLTRVEYYVSPDGGTEWVKLSDLDWAVVKETNDAGAKIEGWTPGSFETTYRETTVNFMNLAIIGNRLVWKAELTTADKTCLPEISSVDLSYNASGPRTFAHTAPVPLSNVIYDANFDWDSTWTDQVFRGHLFSKKLYDPTAWNTALYSQAPNWDAGDVMGGSATTGGAKNPSLRNIITPTVTTGQVTGEKLALSSGNPDGVTKTFTGKLANSGAISGTIKIYGSDTTGRWETFSDSGIRDLRGSLMGHGKINRVTGDFTLTFTRAPGSSTSLTADYSYYSAAHPQTPEKFDLATNTAANLGVDGRWYWDNTGKKYDYDLDGNGSFTTNDANWITNWVQGYRDGASTEKEWYMGAIDHSSPAVIGAPGLQGWYYGSDVPDSERVSFDEYRCEQRTRSTYVYAGTKAGMIHSFYAGEFRPYFVDEVKLFADLPGFTCDFSNSVNLYAFRGDYSDPSSTGVINPNGPKYTPPGQLNAIDINRGYYEWPDSSGPNYGDGSETWGLIPANLRTRLKNNAMKTEDKAFMDASPAAAHIQFSDGSWHTIVMVAEGIGGDQVMAVDVTDPANPTILWEYSDPDLYRSKSAPSVGSVGKVVAGGNSRWVVMFVSGVNTDINAYPTVYMLEIETGKELYSLALDTDPEALGATPSGQPAVLDSDGNGYSDRFYIGTDKGIMFKGIMPDNPTAATGVSFGVCTFFRTKTGTSGERLSIYASPSATTSNVITGTGELLFKVNVFFGTSSSPYHNDDPGDTYQFYALQDTDDKTQCSFSDTLWTLDLPAGQQVFSAAFATAGRVYFGTTSSVSEDPCAPSTAASAGSDGATYVYEAEPPGGSPVEVAKLDTGNVNSSLTVDDKHLYFRTADGKMVGYGGDTFQNETKQGGFSEAVIKSWTEVLR